MKKTKKCLMFLLVILLTLSSSLTTVMAKKKEPINIEEMSFPSGSNPQFFVAYIYISENEENPYNNPNRDIILRFQGKREYYLQAKNVTYASDFAYEKWGVVRVTGYLPDNDKLTAVLEISDHTDDFVYQIWEGDVPITISDPLTVQKEYNEYYLIGGNSTWMTEHVTKQYEDMYRLFHSDARDVNKNIAYDSTVDDELFKYWQTKMTDDLTIQGFRTKDGVTYSREQMISAGYPVPLSMKADDNIKDVVSSDSQTSDTNIPNMDTKKKRSTIPPLAIVIVLGMIIIAFVVIAYIRKEKNESDLYID